MKEYHFFENNDFKFLQFIYPCKLMNLEYKHDNLEQLSCKIIFLRSFFSLFSTPLSS